MQRVFQDWQGWLSEGLLDLAVPMNYARETRRPRARLVQRVDCLEKRHKAGRQLAIGIGAYLSAPEACWPQAARVRSPQGRHRADGMSFFSYYPSPRWRRPLPPAPPRPAVVPDPPRRR